MKRTPLIKFFLTCSIIICAGLTVSYADTLYLIDTSVLTGKVLNETNEGYEFATKIGVFVVKKQYINEISSTGSGRVLLIKKQYIKKAYITDSYKKDIEIQRKLMNKVNEKEIREHYLAGETIKSKMDSLKDADTKTNNKWDYGRIMISASYFSTFISSLSEQYRKINKVLPSGFGGELAYEQGLGKITKKPNMGIPGIRFAFSYLYYTKDINEDKSLEVSGYTVEAGLMWALPSITNSWGFFAVGAMGGVSFIDIINRYTDKKIWRHPPAATAFFGYEYDFQGVSLAFQIRYTFLYDKSIAFHGLGANVGVAFKLW